LLIEKVDYGAVAVRARRTQLAPACFVSLTLWLGEKIFVGKPEIYSRERIFFDELAVSDEHVRESCTPGRRRPRRKEGQQEGPIVVD
jgi:hypothetical protein